MNYYEILNLSPNATDKEIKKSYKKLVKTYHPDLYKGDKDFADKKIKEINEAYEILSNPSSKSSYDNLLNNIQNNNNFTDTTLNNNHNDSIKKEKPTTPRYEDLYKYDYYRKYTTNYYGVDKSEDKKKYDKDNNADNFIEIKISFKIIILMLVLLCFFIITLILLFSLFSKGKNNHDENLNNINIVQENKDENKYDLYAGQTYDEVVDIYGKPDSIKQYDYVIFTYYNDSYIIFDYSGIVVGWNNLGEFNTFQSQYFNMFLF